MERKCVHCNELFNHGVSGNMILFCPYCKKSTGSVSDYGFGPITPCNIYLGEQILGRIINESGNYRLFSEVFMIDKTLMGEYKNLSVYKEAQQLIETALDS